VSGITLNRNPFEVTVEGNFAYLTSDSPNQKVQVVNVANPNSPSLTSTLNLPGNRTALTIASSGNVAYVGYLETFFTVDISNPSSLSVIGSVNVSNSSNINDISLNIKNDEDLVFIATEENSAEIQIIDVSEPAEPQYLRNLRRGWQQ
jgi:hypothetical protein